MKPIEQVVEKIIFSNSPVPFLKTPSLEFTNDFNTKWKTNLIIQWCKYVVKNRTENKMKFFELDAGCVINSKCDCVVTGYSICSTASSGAD